MSVLFNLPVLCQFFDFEIYIFCAPIKIDLIEALKDYSDMVSIHLDEQQEVLEYKAAAVAIVVTTDIDTSDKTINAKILYNSQPLEEIANIDKYNEAYNILNRVKSILSASMIAPTIEADQNQESKKVLVSLVDNEDKVGLIDVEMLANEISGMSEIRTKILVNAVEEEAETELRGYTVPILIYIDLDTQNYTSPSS